MKLSFPALVVLLSVAPAVLAMGERPSNSEGPVLSKDVKTLNGPADTFYVTEDFHKILSEKTAITVTQGKEGQDTNFKTHALNLPKELKFKDRISKAQIARFLDYPIFNYTTEPQNESIDSCKEWLAAGAYGPSSLPSGTRDALIADIISRECKAISILSDAEPAKKSFIPAEGIAKLGLIPKTWRPEKVNNEPYHEDLEFDQREPRILSPHKVVIESYYFLTPQKKLLDPDTLTMTEYARGDFDHDGIEDMLLLAFYNSSGTLKYGWLMAVTRYGAEGEYVNITQKVRTIATSAAAAKL